MDIAEAYFHNQIRLHRHVWSSEQAIEAFWIGYYTNLLHPFVARHDQDGLLQLSRAVNNEFKKHTSWQLYPDVLPTLMALRARGYTLGVISDWGTALGPILLKHGLVAYFDCLLISATAQHAKPSPHLYEQALQRANAIPDYTLHIGDSYIQDVLGARAVGMTPVLLDRKASLKEECIDCSLVYSLYELLDLLEVTRP
jgi:HAD superfamily hydrolase (TIGR01549 family)